MQNLIQRVYFLVQIKIHDSCAPKITVSNVFKTHKLGISALYKDITNLLSEYIDTITYPELYSEYLLGNEPRLSELSDVLGLPIVLTNIVGEYLILKMNIKRLMLLKPSIIIGDMMLRSMLLIYRYIGLLTFCQ